MKQEEVFTACFTSLVAATKDLKGTVSGWEGSSLLTVEGSSPSWGRRHGGRGVKQLVAVPLPLRKPSEVTVGAQSSPWSIGCCCTI